MYEFAVVDTETAGLPNRPHNRIVEIAVVRLSPALQVSTEFETLLNPERDIGPTTIHGISAKSILGAPRFADIAGDIMDRIQGCVIVAHNAPFDTFFLRSEFARLGLELPALPIVCTMQLAHALGKRRISADLEGCCAALGIENSSPHRALSDARATSALFRLIANRMFPDGAVDLNYLNCADRIHWESDCKHLQRSGRSWNREQADSEGSGPCKHLTRLVYRIAGMNQLSDSTHEMAGYIDALDHVLEDRVITADEAEGLFEAAKAWNLSPQEIVEAHRLYLRRLAAAAFADGILTDAELRDLRTVTQIFGFDEPFLQSVLADARESRGNAKSECVSLMGKTVCFTGESICTIRGEYISREMALELAADAGLGVKDNLTKKLDILVVADPYTQSGKAKKAREFGVRILHEPLFWQTIGIQID